MPGALQTIIRQGDQHMIIAVLVTGAFMAGIMIGFIAFLRAGIAREESDRSLLVTPRPALPPPPAASLACTCARPDMSYRPVP